MTPQEIILTKDILTIIFNYFTPREILIFRYVNKIWYIAANNVIDQLQKNMSLLHHNDDIIIMEYIISKSLNEYIDIEQNRIKQYYSEQLGKKKLFKLYMH